MILIDLPDEIIRKILDNIGYPFNQYYCIINSCKKIKNLNYHLLFVPIKLFSYYICNYNYVINSNNSQKFIKNKFKTDIEITGYFFFEYLYDLMTIIDVIFFKKNEKIKIDNLFHKKKIIDSSPILLLHDTYNILQV